MEDKKRFLSRFLRSYRSLPDKKKYVEFFTAILTVPVLLTVIILNLTSLKKDEQPKPAAQEQPKIVITIPEKASTSSSDKGLDPTSTPQPACKKEIGPVEISTPEEGDTVKDNPVSIIVTQKAEGYCAIVWSYRINAGRWSDYDDKSIALYNPPKGTIILELRVKSVVTGEEIKLTRKFLYEGVIDTTATSSGSTTN